MWDHNRICLPILRKLSRRPGEDTGPHETWETSPGGVSGIQPSCRTFAGAPLATIVHILVSLVVAVLRAFVGAFVALFSRAALGVGILVAIVLLALGLTGTAGFAFRRRKD